jgi:hypothetical protein
VTPDLRRLAPSPSIGYIAAMHAPPGMFDLYFPSLMCGTWAICFCLRLFDPPRWLRSPVGGALCLLNAAYLVRPFHWYVPQQIGDSAGLVLMLASMGFALPFAWGWELRAKPEAQATGPERAGLRR